ncbi:cellulose binding domain-containing protein [Streptomyces hoynatensis]|uniref:Cellulose-binding protein n=1 Tax=Streptomyces hoynatensis TaxID=1141874 RepID=A0A3A9ZBA5_9ACTN|nr:cellulose binding domain-containing protein [Streptomyces hoynatensis]RKN45601.1 cellulose-binding protein [Streptomyces hoynatensis]
MRFHRYRPRVWLATIFVALASLAFASLVPEAGAAGSLRTAAATPFADEDDGADCNVQLPGSTPSSSLLPDPFTRIDGTRITSRSDWRCRRAEIRELAERYVYGEKHSAPQSVTGTVSRTGITVNVSDQGRSATFSATVDLPSGTGPFPAVIVYGGFGADTAAIKAAGAAVISYDPYAVGAEGTPRTSKQGAYYSIYGSSSSTGLLMAWAWGVSRIIDVIEQSDGSILRANATGVTGCSRFGKGAFVAGAFDQRIALTMPIESGTGGAPIFRGVPGESGSQPLSSAYSEQPWLGDAFGSYTGNPAGLPVDTHEMVAMIAPRGLFMMENPHVDWLGARSGSVAALGGAEVYKALGVPSNISYWSDVQDGTHCASRSEWRAPLQQSIQTFLLGTGNPPGVFRISSAKAGNLSQWRDWQTPTLTDDGGTAGGTGGEEGDDGGEEGDDGGDEGAVGGGEGDSGGDSGGEGNEGACTASFRTVSSWSGGYQGEVSVRNNGTSALRSWTVGMTLASWQSLTNLWNGVNTGTGGAVTVRNTAWNGTVAAGGSVSFGFVVGGSPTTAPGDLTCTAT